MQAHAAHNPWLRSSSVGALEPRSPTLDCSDITWNTRNHPFILQFPELIHFLQKLVKTQKTQKESKIEQNSTIKKLTSVNKRAKI
jgi:hypothetical protein